MSWPIAVINLPATCERNMVEQPMVAIRHFCHDATRSHGAAPQVVEALQASLPSLSGDQQYDYEAVLELYGTTRMMMAVLGKQQLAQVISGLDCDFYDVLGPVRAVRPSCGGAGHDNDILNDLRMLHFQIDHRAT